MVRNTASRECRRSRREMGEGWDARRAQRDAHPSPFVDRGAIRSPLVKRAICAMGNRQTAARVGRRHGVTTGCEIVYPV
jgi:hypothetical protein